MTQWHSICKANELPPDTRKAVVINSIPILIFNLEGDYYAIQNRCTHQDFPLLEGELEDDILMCPLHGAKFSIKTGEAKASPAFVDVPTYPTRVEDEWVQCLV